MQEAELRTIFNNKKEHKSYNKSGQLKITAGFTSLTTFEHFKDWFNQSKFDEGCRYCGTTNEKSRELYNLRPYATRGGKRGKRLELDRIDPLQPYDNLKNLVWCCYWCNNAKTNFFSEKEFEPIGRAIGEILMGIK